MTTATPPNAVNPLPISQTLAPADQDEVIAAVADCFAAETAVYPIGGGASLDFGLPAKEEGVGLSLAEMDNVIDFPARDLTISVEAGISMRRLANVLAEENLRLPIDVPKAETATIGGVIATNWNGPRRYGQGTVRDHVIGISAVDGRGKPFKGGGRVVKNVAGYDFCKLLTGSLGTLGVITQVTLRLKPIPQRSALFVARAESCEAAEEYLAALVESETTPVAVELLAGPHWADAPAIGPVLAEGSSPERACALAVGLEGSEPEVRWMLDTLDREWQAQGVPHSAAVVDDDAAVLWQRLAEFPQAGESPLALKANMTPSRGTEFVEVARQIDPQCSIQAHAGNGVVIVRFAEFPADGLSRTLVQQLEPIAVKGRGNVVVLSNPSGAEMTHQSVWGGIDAPFALMTDVKRQFDPKNILNPGRFVYV